MSPGGAFGTASSPARFTALLVIAGAHLLLVVAMTLLGCAKVVVEKTKPLLVQFVMPAAPPSRPTVAPVPLPAMRTPEIHVPMPAIETIAVQQEERPVAPPSAPAKAAPVVAEARKSIAAPAPAEAPRFDLAYLNNPAPVYPPISRRLREEGRVMLRVLVNPSGLVEDVEILSTSGHARLDQSALAAVRRWKFVPAQARGEAIAGWALVPIAFNLQG